MIVTTLDNKKFRIENGNKASDIEKVFIDHKKATQISEPPETCYKT